MPHRRTEAPAGMAEVRVDVCFLGEENDPGNTLRVLVMRGRKTKVTLAAALPSKTANTSGKRPNEREVIAARGEEPQFMNDLVVFEEASWEQCVAESCTPLATTRRVNVEKASGEVWSRLAAGGFKPKGDGLQADMFAAMPLGGQEVAIANGRRTCMPTSAGNTSWSLSMFGRRTEDQ